MHIRVCVCIHFFQTCAEMIGYIEYNQVGAQLESLILEN